MLCLGAVTRERERLKDRIRLEEQEIGEQQRIAAEAGRNRAANAPRATRPYESPGDNIGRDIGRDRF
jgi:hypothetical protein